MDNLKRSPIQQLRFLWRTNLIKSSLRPNTFFLSKNHFSITKPEMVLLSLHSWNRFNERSFACKCQYKCFNLTRSLICTFNIVSLRMQMTLTIYLLLKLSNKQLVCMCVSNLQAYKCFSESAPMSENCTLLGHVCCLKIVVLEIDSFFFSYF